jgi:phosphoribosyl-AMP cyclohydrolase
MTEQTAYFPQPGNKSEQELGNVFSPKFGADGLVTAVVCDATSGALLMVGYMNAHSLIRTLETGEAHYWSRSRQELWHKGATSGNVQKIVEITTDCDQDALLLKVEVTGHGATCHTGHRSCFFRKVILENGKTRLITEDAGRLFDPDEVYGKK